MIDCTNADAYTPVPTGTGANLPFSTLRTRALAACAAAKLLLKEGYSDNTPANNTAIRAVMEEYAAAKPAEAQKALTNTIKTPAGAIRVNTLLSEFDALVVRDAQRIRNYVTNRLLIESTDKDPRIRLRALENLGKISDVGLFTERSEITINNRSTNDLQAQLKEKINKLLGIGQPVEDVESRDISGRIAEAQVGEFILPPLTVE